MPTEQPPVDPTADAPPCCTHPDGSLTSVARDVLCGVAATPRPVRVAEVAGVPLYRVRESLRELEGLGLVRSEARDRWVLTPTGVDALG